VGGPGGPPRAGAGGPPPPGAPDAVADSKPGRTLTECVHHANHLMTRRNVGPLGKQIPLGQMEIGAADTAACDPDPDLLAKRHWHIPFSPLQGSGIDRPRLMHDPGVHLAILTS
jgi:hypothetical protein